MQKVLVVIGGKRAGDTLHLIPFFESIKDKEVTWITGTYEKYMAQLIQRVYPNIFELKFINDGFPGNLNDCENFAKSFWSENDRSFLEKEYDEIYDDYTVSFDLSPLYWKLKDNYFPVKKTSGDYIVYHLDTVSDWKRHVEIRDLDIPNVLGYSLGTTNEFILPGTIDFTNRSLIDVVNLIAGAKMFVGIHSSMGCLSLYVNPKKSIIIHPFDGLLKFGDFRENFVDLIKPTTEELKRYILEVINIRS